MKKDQIGQTLVTGSAGFIGFHAARTLLDDGQEVLGLDNLSDYYDVKLKLSRNAILGKYKNYKFCRLDLCDYAGLQKIFKKERVVRILHLAAQPGVRYSIAEPFAYQKSNNEGFLNIIECARRFKIKQFVYASSSSVYGGNKKLPFSEKDNVDRPVSLYAATKKSNELIAHAYSRLYGINAIGLRFFSVYGPWGRPDMAYFSFTEKILSGKPIYVFNRGKMKRDFTFISDIAAGITAALKYDAEYEIFNLGNDRTESLMDLIACLEKELGKTVKKVLLPMQPGDIKETWADIKSAREKLNYRPKTDLRSGIKEFVTWYRKYYGRGG